MVQNEHHPYIGDSVLGAANDEAELWYYLSVYNINTVIFYVRYMYVKYDKT